MSSTPLPEITAALSGLLGQAKAVTETRAAARGASVENEVVISQTPDGPSVEISRTLLPDPAQREHVLLAVTEAVTDLLASAAPDSSLDAATQAKLEQSFTNYFAEGTKHLEERLAELDGKFAAIRERAARPIRT